MNTQSDKVYSYILQKIKSNEWVAGDRIYSENELCSKTDVSRIAVRAALDKLSALGVLEKRKGAGTYVSEIDISNIVGNIAPLMTLKPMDIMDVLRFRLYFEPGNVKEFMKNYDPLKLDALKETYAKMQSHTEDSQDFYIEDYEFHTIIAKGTKNPIVISINEMLTGILITSQQLTNLKIGPGIGLYYHSEIINAIERKDTEMATLLMTRHIEDTIKRVQGINE